MSLLSLSKAHPTSRVVALDGLRGWAIFIVLCGHFAHHYSFLPLKMVGTLGVYLFFVLSAYLLDTQIIAFLRSPDRPPVRFWINYFLRRFLRIYPLYALALGLNFLLETQGLPCISIGGFSGLIDHLLLKEGVFIFWSIPVEFTYYFVSPLLMVIGAALSWRWLPVVALFALTWLACSWYLHTVDNNVPLFYNISPFLIGSLVAYLRAFWPQVMLRLKGSIALWLALLALLVPFVLIPDLYGVDRSFFLQKIGTFAIVFGFLLLVVLADAHSFLAIFTKNKFFRHLGLISFSTYLFHMNIILWVVHSWGETVVSLFISMALIAVLCTLSYRYIERPLATISLE